VQLYICSLCVLLHLHVWTHFSKAQDPKKHMSQKVWVFEKSLMKCLEFQDICFMGEKFFSFCFFSLSINHRFTRSMWEIYTHQKCLEA
jgi:hypothetical protein